jgi:hypothetical protein
VGSLKSGLLLSHYHFCRDEDAASGEPSSSSSCHTYVTEILFLRLLSLLPRCCSNKAFRPRDVLLSSTTTTAADYYDPGERSFFQK